MRQVEMKSTRKQILEKLEPAVPELAVRQFLITNLQVCFPSIVTVTRQSTDLDENSLKISIKLETYIVFLSFGTKYCIILIHYL